MKAPSLILAGLQFHWRHHMAVLLGVVVGTSVLTGALLVGDSVRGSLGDLAAQRLGAVDCALVGNRFFREELATELRQNDDSSLNVGPCEPLILVRGTTTRLDVRGREAETAGRVNVLGIRPAFWDLGGYAGGMNGIAVANESRRPSDRDVVLNVALARELNLDAGGELLLRFQAHSAVPRESVLGRKTETVRTLRARVARVAADAAEMSRFSLEPSQQEPLNVYVPLETLQRALGRPGGVNAVLVTQRDTAHASPQALAEALNQQLARRLQLADLDLRLRHDAQRGYVSLESGRMILEPVAAQAVVEAAEAIGVKFAPALVQLATAIEKAAASDPHREGPTSTGLGTTHSLPARRDSEASTSHRTNIPYSIIAALDPAADPPLGPLPSANGQPVSALADDDILLNSWAAADLDAKPGDTIVVRYFSTDTSGGLQDAAASFRLRGVVAMQGLGADPALVPEYPGVTNARTLGDWDPPFPMDHSRIRRQDEAYWQKYHTTPKAFVSLATGEQLWASRFGKWTSVRLGREGSGFGASESRHAGVRGRGQKAEPGGQKRDGDADWDDDEFERVLRTRLKPNEFGLAFQPVKERMLAAASGATDFAGLFVGFSFFLIASAVLLVGLLFRLGVERRAREVGVLRAVGFTPRQVRGVFLGEGGVVALAGTTLGAAAGLGYAWLMLAGLRTWWFDAVRTSELYLHATWLSIGIGCVASLWLGLLAMWWALAQLGRLSPRTLLAGATQESLGRRTGSGRWPGGVGAMALAAAGVSAVAGLTADVSAVAFFVTGMSMLIACLAFMSRHFAREDNAPVPGAGWRALARLGARNAARRPGRSVLTAGLIASATFVIVSVAANRREPDQSVPHRDSGDGGFALVAESDSPLFHDLNTDAGRAAFDLDKSLGELTHDMHVVSFRRRPGDDASCLNLYKPQQPRILGAPAAMVQRGGFRFARSTATSASERENPWRLLDTDLPGGAIPTIGDANTLQWILHLGIGDSLRLVSELGEPVELKVVAALDRSLFQGELIISESNFLRVFPSQAGYSYFLVEAPPDCVDAVRAALERGLRDFGLDATTTAGRLAEFHAVENTYLATFQTLGGLGLVLGSLGLGIVLLRGVLERRSELALLRAVGYGHAALVWLVLAENAFLLVIGLGAGAGSALVAVAPHLWSAAAGVEWLPVTGTLLAVFGVGLLAGLVSLLTTVRTALLPALRAE